MSVSEPEACLHGYGERRMSVMIAARAASSTAGANHDIMSVSEREQTKFVHRERRMAIMIAAKAASSTAGANHDIMSAREPEGACSLLANGEEQVSYSE